ncbi:hypothetical protein OE88DRAFT_1272795 [Heliocybe sulcata]|uniref:Uncharacterized protein n=1 Tax=Heliocybe sulcata TaxID=5364 RepID=A0A5C3N8R1_9AGAM|nr:hypothetical protein OE88DRAFT_1272795 [Heliocybe sulcata]
MERSKDDQISQGKHGRPSRESRRTASEVWQRRVAGHCRDREEENTAANQRSLSRKRRCSQQGKRATPRSTAMTSPESADRHKCWELGDQTAPPPHNSSHTQPASGQPAHARICLTMPFNYHHDRPALSSSSSSNPSLTHSDSTLSSSPELSSPLQQLSISEASIRLKETAKSGGSFDLVAEEEEMKQKADCRGENRDGVLHGPHRPAHVRANSKSFTSRVDRPVLPPRQISFSKRHASFDSPAEVPFPSPLSHPSQTPSGPPPTHSRTHSRVLSSEHPRAAKSPVDSARPASPRVSSGTTVSTSLNPAARVDRRSIILIPCFFETEPSFFALGLRIRRAT